MSNSNSRCHGLAGYHGLTGWLVTGWLAWVDRFVVQFHVLKAVGTAILGAEGCGSIPSALVVLRIVVRFQVLWFDSISPRGAEGYGV